MDRNLILSQKARTLSEEYKLSPCKCKMNYRRTFLINFFAAISIYDMHTVRGNVYPAYHETCAKTGTSCGQLRVKTGIDEMI